MSNVMPAVVIREPGGAEVLEVRPAELLADWEG